MLNERDIALFVVKLFIISKYEPPTCHLLIKISRMRFTIRKYVPSIFILNKKAEWLCTNFYFKDENSTPNFFSKEERNWKECVINSISQRKNLTNKHISLWGNFYDNHNKSNSKCSSILKVILRQ